MSPDPFAALSFDEAAVFREEAADSLDVLEQGLLAMERADSRLNPDGDLVQELFRAAHTLKGNAGAAGMGELAGTAHRLEDRLALLRDEGQPLTTEEIDRYLGLVDRMRTLVGLLSPSGDAAETAADRSPTGTPETAAARSSASASQVTAAAGAPGPALSAVNVPVTIACIEVADYCPMPSIRLFQVFQALDAAGIDVVSSEPAAADVEQGSDSRMLILHTAASYESVTAAIAGVPDVSVSKGAGLPVEFVEPVQPSKVTAVAPPQAVADSATMAPRPAAADSNAVAHPSTAAAATPESLRVDVALLDQMMNLIGELVVDRTRLAATLQPLGELATAAALREVADHLARVTEDLQELVTRSRMQPLASIFRRVPRLLRDLEHSTGKELQVRLEGEETELDRVVATRITDPLVHLIRNAVDHGIETADVRRAAGKPKAGLITLRAWRQENTIRIAVSDDGAGIDTDKVRVRAVSRRLVDAETAAKLSEQELIDFIFHPGFSTSDQVTEISGRGVGMDIVRKSVERIGGQVSVDSVRGAGTTVTLTLPLTLAILRALLVEASGTPFAIPLTAIDEVVQLDLRRLPTLRGIPSLVWRDHVLNVRDLHSFLIEVNRLHTRQTPASGETVADIAALLQRDKTQAVSADSAATRPAVIVHHSSRREAWLVDRLLGEQEIVLKPLGRWLENAVGLAGAAILGDGRIALVLDTGAAFAEPSPAAPAQSA
mgnify:CR=1 FL=1